MKFTGIRVAMAALCMLAVAGARTRADDESKADSKKLAAQTEKLLEAYNKDDVKAFYKGWASSVASIANEMTYDALYKNGAKKTVGEYTAKTLKFRKEGSVLTGDILVVYFDCEFSKEKEGQIAVNFQKEEGEYKFMQVQMSKKN